MPASGTQNAGQPKASGGGRKFFTPTEVILFSPSANGQPSLAFVILGVEGAKPHPGGFGGCPPNPLPPARGFKKGGELPTLAKCLRVGPKTLVNPKPTGVGKIFMPTEVVLFGPSANGRSTSFGQIAINFPVSSKILEHTIAVAAFT